jgi:ATP-dependent Clp protease adaptor protein ClpS
MRGGDEFGADRDESFLDLIPRRVERPGLWNVVLHDDETTSLDFVTDVLVNLFRRPVLEAFGVAFEIHVIGKGTAGTFSFEVAAEKRAEVLRLAQIERFPLLVGLERA